MRKGIFTPDPATYYEARSNPTEFCEQHHADGIYWVVGCSVHDDILPPNGQCAWCEYEKATGRYYNTIPMESKRGYVK